MTWLEVIIGAMILVSAAGFITGYLIGKHYTN